MPGYVSGVPQEVSPGVWAGLTNFSEFPAGDPEASPPAGMTRYGRTDEDPTAFQIIDDPNEGHYLQMTGHNIGSDWGVGIDAFDGLQMADRVEVLARVWTPTPLVSNRAAVGVACRMSGDSQSLMTYFGASKGGSNSSAIINKLSGQSNGVLAQGAMQQSDQNGVWHWIRWRIQVLPGSNNDVYSGKCWFGALADEPAAWDYNVTNGNFALAPAGGAIGPAAVGGFKNQNAQRVAFLSWTEDPDNFPTPTPDDVLTPGSIVPPVVTASPQATYVALQGTPFEVVT